MLCVVLRAVQGTMLVVAALTSLLQFQEVQSLPLSARPASYNSIIDVASNSPTKDLQGHKYGDGETENRIVRVTRNVGPEWENETAASVIYHANEREYRLDHLNTGQLVHACMFMQEI